MLADRKWDELKWHLPLYDSYASCAGQRPSIVQTQQFLKKCLWRKCKLILSGCILKPQCVSCMLLTLNFSVLYWFFFFKLIWLKIQWAYAMAMHPSSVCPTAIHKNPYSSQSTGRILMKHSDHLMCLHPHCAQVQGCTSHFYKNRYSSWSIGLSLVKQG